MSDGFEWLDWLEPSGPFLAAPVLKSAFPQGLGTLDPSKRKALRQAYDEYREALESEDPESDKIHAAWIDLVLRQGLEYDEDESGDNLKSADELPDRFVIKVAEHGVTLRSDFGFVGDQNADKPMMLIQVYDPDVDLNDAVGGDGWASSPRERMVRLCHDTGTRLGLVTNGEHWLFVDAPVGAVSSFANWYARLWGPEPVLLQAFVVLLGIRRFFLAADEQLPALIDKSVEYQDEVTEALGEQVRRAVEVLIQALDKADLDRNRDLLRDVDPRELYEAGLTVMMRLVFLLSAEERELLLLGDERYEANYAVSTLRIQLRGEDDAILQRRWDAWSRLLAIFRAIYGGIEHETLRMPALGGSLFDPDRFPFLEGRDKDSNWKTDPAKPLPIDNQTVLLLLDAIQLFEGRTLSYRGLDIEQLGYVYEGLLDHTVKRAEEVTLELNATKSAKQPWITLGELESARLDGDKAVEKLLKERTGSSISRVRNDLMKEVKTQQSVQLLTACHNVQVLHDQLKGYFHLIRTDSWGRPLVYPKGSFMVTTGEDRRQSGSHYTPTTLTEAIVRETLEPVVYVGPAEGRPREEWQLKSSEELLDLKICDPAMGSGAFLVQVCRWLGERLVEAWAKAEESGRHVCFSGLTCEANNASEPMPKNSEERSVNARRLIAERCLYGVDLNPLAVELAKLSIWLVTMAKGRPFGYLDHSLRSGDSLLGLSRLDQLTELSINPVSSGQQRLFGRNINQAVLEANNSRQVLRDRPIHDIRDVQAMAQLDIDVRHQLNVSNRVADAFIGEVFNAGSNLTDLERRLATLAINAERAINGDFDSIDAMARRTDLTLSVKTSARTWRRHPFHWPLEFPEVFDSKSAGFDALLGNPPFMGGLKISERLGQKYVEFLTWNFKPAGRLTDLCAYFFRRATRLASPRAAIGFLATNTISQGVTRKGGLDPIIANGVTIIDAVKSFSWPGKASVHTAKVVLYTGNWNAMSKLNGTYVLSIDSFLDEKDEGNETPEKLNMNKGMCFQGVNTWGKEFILTQEQANTLLAVNERNCRVIKPLMGGEEIAGEVEIVPKRWAIDMDEMDEEEASSYPEIYNYLKESIYPRRSAMDPKKYARIVKYWWRYFNPRQILYRTIDAKKLTLVFARARTSDYHTIEQLPANIVHLDSAVVFLFEDLAKFSILQSCVHEIWSRKFSSSLGSGMRYVVGDCFDTFPFPKLDEPGAERSDLRSMGKEFVKLRAAICVEEQISRTELMSRVYDRSNKGAIVEQMRAAIKRLDSLAVKAYAWGDISIAHDFHEWNGKTRFTLDDASRREILRRLLQLNNQLHEEEGIVDVNQVGRSSSDQRDFELE